MHETISKLILLVVCMFVSVALSAQTDDSFKIFHFEAGTTLSGKNNVPFYIFSNRSGLLTNQQFNMWAGFGLRGKRSLGKKNILAYNFKITDRYAASNKVFVSQAYGELNLQYINFKAGLWEEAHGNQDSTISSGSILWSGNARPVPKISISTTEYLPVPFTGNKLSFKAGISHGWLGDNRFVSNVLLHHKYLYLKSAWDFPVNFEYGLQHFAQWGGTASDTAFGNLPSDVNTYIRIFLAKGGTNGAPEEELVNAIGNHLGSHNFRVFYRGPVDVDLYLQTIFEDKSGQQLRNFPDGLWGLEFSSSQWKVIRKVLFEFLHTSDQSGALHGHFEDDVFITDGGDDNYFNHFIYGGWIYKNMTIGNPFLLSPELTGVFKDEPIINNKIHAFHIGADLKTGKVYHRILYSYSKNMGNIRNSIIPANKRNSFLLETTLVKAFPLNINLTFSFAADFGDFHGNNYGILFKIIKDIDLQ